MKGYKVKIISIDGISSYRNGYYVNNIKFNGTISKKGSVTKFEYTDNGTMTIYDMPNDIGDYKSLISDLRDHLEKYKKRILKRKGMNC